MIKSGQFQRGIERLREGRFLDFLQVLKDSWWLFKTRFFFRPFFRGIGPGSLIMQPLRFKNPRNILLGERVAIQRLSYLMSLPSEKTPEPVIVVGDGTVLGNFNHVTALRRVVIGREVLTADRVFISDHSHGFSRVDQAVILQEPVFKGEVVIGDGTWIGENVCIQSARIGRNCVIGANSVVTRDIPDRCVAAGAPARVIRRHDPLTGEWKRAGEGEGEGSP